mgnify:CR=1 FL=1
MPTPKKTDKTMPSAVSCFRNVFLMSTLINKVPMRPVVKAPNSNNNGFLLRVRINEMHMPGSAACEMTSPNKLCFRNTAKLPNMPQIAPRTAVPSVIVRRV